MNLFFFAIKTKRKFIKIFRWILSLADINLVRNSEYKKLTQSFKEKALVQNQEKLLEHDSKFLLKLDPENRNKLISFLPQSHSSELHQDLFVLSTLKFKRNGYFVEFGATNGLDGSNTYLLENSFGWKGILAEPAKGWHAELMNNRPSAKIEFKCVWKDSNSEVIFKEIVDAPELSTIKNFIDEDLHSNSRKHGKQYKVKTISLNDLLDKFDAPEVIDYISIDTEGSEYEILQEFNFDKYRINIIHCEHNYNDKREAIKILLERNGFKRVVTELSLYDDWYINNSLKIE